MVPESRFPELLNFILHIDLKKAKRFFNIMKKVTTNKVFEYHEESYTLKQEYRYCKENVS